MPEWLVGDAEVHGGLSAATIAIRLVVSLLAGLAVALIYRASHGRESRDPGTLQTTVVLLAVLIAMVTMVIGNSVARAFSLVGALSIVRFRTVVDDTRDTAFVIFAVIVGMATGTGLHLVPLVGIPIVGAASILLSGRRKRRRDRGDHSELIVRLGFGRDPQEIIEPALARHASSAELVASETAKQGAAVDFTYRLTLASPDARFALVSELNLRDGVQSAEWRRC